METTHVLKCWSEYFSAKWNGNKDWELRKNDRDYKVGDILINEEGDIVNNEFIPTGRCLSEKVIFILEDKPELGLKEGYCIMSTKVIGKNTKY